MPIWSSEIKELEMLYDSFKGQLPELEKELVQLIHSDDPNVILLYSRRCLEIIITDLCECELRRERGTEPLKGIIDKLNKEKKIPHHIIASIHSLNELSTFGTHPKDFDPEQIKPVLNNLDIIIKWYLKYKEATTEAKAKPVEEIREEMKSTEEIKKNFTIPKKKFIAIISSIIAVILVVIVVLLLSNKEPEKSIAVLPFINESPVDSNKHFINGVMEEILNNLQAIKEFRVLARTSTSQYQDLSRPTIPEIAKKLGVSYIVEGSGQKYGNTITLRVQLIRAKRKETHIWAKTYNEEIREVRDYVQIQSDVAKKIAAELKVAITPEEKQLIEKNPTTSMSAYNLYLKANDFLKEYQETLDISSYYTSVNMYKEALKEDSAFARAYTGLANAYLIRNKWEDFFKENYLDSMLALIDKAISIDDKLDEAYYLKGKYCQETGQFDEALDNYDKALKINPNYFSPYYEKAQILIFVKQDYVKGLESIHKSSNLDFGIDRPVELKGVGYAYLTTGFPDKAKYYCQEALKLDGDSANYFLNMARLEFCIGNLEDAISFCEKAVKIDTTILVPFEYYSFTGQDEKAYLAAKKHVEQIEKTGELPLAYSHRIGYAFLRAGKDEEARCYLDQQIKFGEDSTLVDRFYLQRNSAYYDLAATYAFLGDTSKAYKYLDEYNKMDFYSSFIISYFKHDVLFNSIRNEERFQKILQNMEAKYQAEHERVRKWLEEQEPL